MKKLLKYLKNYSIKAIFAPLFKMLEASFELLVPLVMIRLIDIGILQNDTSYVIKSGIILILLTVVGYLFSISAQYFAARAAMGFGKELRSDLFRHIESLSYAELDKVGSSTLITRMTSDVNQVMTGVNMFLRLFLRSPFIVIGAVIMAFTVDVHTSTVFLVVLPFLVIVVFGITYASIPLYRRVQDKLDKVTCLTREELMGIRVIRAFNRQAVEEKAFDEASNDLMNSQLKVGRLSAMMNPVTFLIVNMGILMLIYFGAIRVEKGLLSTGQVVALVNYMSQILIELVKLANLIITLTKSLASARRISDVFDLSPSVTFDNHGDEILKINEIDFDNISMSYPGSRENAIENISFKVKKGETVGIIGGTGSGKSTLINLIPRFYDATEGNLKINGKDIKSFSKKSIRSSVGIVPQKSELFKGTVRENVAFGKTDLTDEDIKKALDISQSSEFINEKAGVLDYEVAQNGKNFSGGQRQRLCIARAIAKDPEILILDDSSSALDYVTESKLRKSLMELTKDRITFIVSQRPSSIMYADKILVLDDGTLQAIGTHDELYRTNEIYKEICDTQLKEREDISHE